MARTLAYGMFPVLQPHRFAGHYFTRLNCTTATIAVQNIPLCRVAEAGWEPITRARSSDDRVYVERFGERYLTVFNDSSEPRTATIQLEIPPPVSGRELVTDTPMTWTNGAATLQLGAEDVAVIDLGP